MDTKSLYATALVIAVISSGYYYYSGKSKKLEVESSRSMTYAAEQINLTQTDERGFVSVRAQADRLEQNLQKQTSKLENLNASTFKDGKKDATFFSKVINGYDDNAKLVLSEQVVATRFMTNGTEMVLKTTELTGYPKTRDLQTDKQITVETPQAQFISQGMKANLNNGQYEFFNIRGKYEP